LISASPIVIDSGDIQSAKMLRIVDILCERTGRSCRVSVVDFWISKLFSKMPWRCGNGKVLRYAQVGKARLND